MLKLSLSEQEIALGTFAIYREIMQWLEVQPEFQQSLTISTNYNLNTNNINAI